METIIQKKPIWLSIIRWSSRIIAVLFAIILFFSFTVEDMNPLSINPQNYFFQALWVLIPTGYLIGLWKKEGLGGLISLISILTLIILLLTREGHYYSFYFYLILIIFTIPSILYLLYWYFNKIIKAKANSTPD